MKKVLVFILIMSGLAVLAQAQYKPESGSVTTELQLSLFSFNAKIDYDDETINYSSGPFTMQGLRFRYFFNEKLALRATIGLNFDHDKVVKNLDDSTFNYYYYYDTKSITTGERTSKTRSTTFSIAPGLEYHFGKWERMSLYVGGELFFGVTTSKSTIDENKTSLNYRNFDSYPSENYVYTEKVDYESSTEAKNCKRGYGYGNNDYIQNAPMAFGINALLGMDFYIYKGLYMGAEFGLGYAYQTYLKGSYKENSITVTTPDIGTPDIKDNSKEVKVEDKISAGNFSVRYNPMIRVGWKFR